MKIIMSMESNENKDHGHWEVIVAEACGFENVWRWQG